MSGFWSDRRVLVTGGTGFLGRHVAAKLEQRGVASLATPSSSDYDLRVPGDVERMFDDLQPDLVIHLAARVGGIGANQAHPASLYLDNLLMGTYVIEQARRSATPKTVVTGTICSYPKHTPVPFSESSLWQGYPEETNAPYGIAKLAQLVQAQSNRAQYGQNVVYLMPTNLYGPGDKFNAAVSHVIPALIKKCVEAREAGDDHIEVWGTGAASREFLYVDDAAEGIILAAERYDGPEPANLGTDEEVPIRAAWVKFWTDEAALERLAPLVVGGSCLGGDASLRLGLGGTGDQVPIRDLVPLIAEATGFTGEVRWDTSKPDGQPRRRVDPSRAADLFGFKAQTPFSVGLKTTVEWYEANREEAESRAV